MSAGSARYGRRDVHELDPLVLTPSHDDASPQPAPTVGAGWLRWTPGRRWRRVIAGFVGALAALVLLVGTLFLYDYATATVPPPGAAVIAPPTVLLDVHGDQIRHLDAAEVGEQVASEELPEHAVRAVLAAEDHRFFEHDGFSLPSILRAAATNLRSGRIEQGASTITQQYVDLTTPGSGRSYRGKLREVATAAKVERSLDKRQILDRYLNLVPFGRDAIGIDAAAQVYYRVPATELDVNQAATLAGMIAAPSALDPARNPQGARARRDTVVNRMAELRWLQRSAADRIEAQDLPELATDPLVRYGPDAYFVDAVRRELLEALPDVRDLGRGLVVHTTLDTRMQRLAQESLASHVADAPDTGAIVSIDPASGEVRALVGGPNFASQPFNAAVQARRQPGSAFKPLTLAAFIEDGRSPDTTRYDAPARLQVGSDTVANFGGAGYGRLSVREATVKSVNTVYMQMIEDVGASEVADLAEEMGIESELPAVPSLTLGTGEVTPIELASAYATLAANGTHRSPTLLRSVEEPDGDVIHEPDDDEHRALPETTAAKVSEILAEVVQRGTGTPAQIDRPVAGKTGTTDASRDAWFVGYTPQLATAVWVGNRDNSAMGDATGGGLAAPIWAEYVRAAMEPLPVVDLLTADPDDEPGGDDDGGEPDRDDTEPDEADDDADTPSPDPSPPEPTEPTSEPSTPGPASTETESSPSPSDDEPAPPRSSDSGSPSESESESEDGGLLPPW